MKKALLPLLIASVVPATAMADITVYGKAFVTFQNSSLDKDQTFTEVVNNASRIGFKGSEVVNDDLKAIYQFEYQTAPDNGTVGLSSSPTCATTSTSKSTTTNPAATTTTTTTTTCSVSGGGQTFSQRNIYVGLQGEFGTVKLGMFDTPLKLAQEKVDQFNDMIGDLQYVMKGETRAKNVVAYTSPTVAHFTGEFAYVNSEKDSKNAAGDKTENGYSASVNYTNGNFYGALALDHNVSNAVAGTIVTSANDTDILRAVARYKAGSVTLGAMYETYDHGTADTENGSFVSVKWDIPDSKWALKSQYGKSDMNVLGGKTFSLGADYKLSKKATWLVYYTDNQDDITTVASRTGGNYFGTGFELNF